MGQRIDVRHDLPTVADARAAVLTARERLVALLRSGLDGDSPAVGHWSVGDVTAHMSHVYAFDVLSAQGNTSFDDVELPEFIHDRSVLPAIEEVGEVEDVNRVNQAVLDQDPERSLDVLADRIDGSLETLGDVLAAADDSRTVTWLGGTELPIVAIAGHVLFEAGCHGLDIARAAGRSWTIDPSHVRTIFDGFMAPFINAAPGVVGGGSDGATGCIDLRLRGQTRASLVFDESGPHIERGPRDADLHVSADPVTFLLVMAGRTSRLKAAATGGVVAWGRRPLRGFRLMSRLRTP
jgi:uncharacterized protein (TIGR03083 family)